jgi:hypothetical protein
MSPGVLRLLEHVHGHLGWLSVAALLHPVIVLRNPRRVARWTVALAAGFTAATAMLGATIYPAYRERVRPVIFAEAPRIGWMFERKEHLAVGAVGLALAGCVAHLAALNVTDGRAKATAARLAHRAFVGAFVLALAAATLGVVVAATRSFG